MASLALPNWTHPRHPIVHGETRHWQRSRVWRATRYVLWGGSLLFLAVPLLCPLLINLSNPGYSSPAEAILITGGTVTLGLAVVSAVAGGLNGVLAGLLGATLISRERECQSWPFLRLTTLTSLEIVGGKFTALLRSLVNPLFFVLALRLLVVLAAVLTVALAAASTGLNFSQLWELWNSLGLGMSAPDWLLLQGTGLVGALVALAGWLIEPYFSVVYSGAVALAASSLARSRGAGIVLTVAVHFVLGLGLYAPVQQISTLVGALSLPNSSAPASVGVVPVALMVALPLAAQTALQVGILVFCLVFALNRAERLSE